eukprot:1851565-Prymnesium_polylepis.2
MRALCFVVAVQPHLELQLLLYDGELSAQSRRAQRPPPRATNADRMQVVVLVPGASGRSSRLLEL